VLGFLLAGFAVFAAIFFGLPAYLFARG